MPALREFQSAVSAAIREAAATERLTVRPLDTFAQPERLVLHARNYRVGLTAVLVSIFPATQRLAGEGFFAFAAAQFIAAKPPQDPVLAHYGSALPEFLAALPALERSPWLADVARLEWAIHALSDERLRAPLDMSGLAHLTDARVTWHPGATLFHAHRLPPTSSTPTVTWRRSISPARAISCWPPALTASFSTR